MTSDFSHLQLDRKPKSTAPKRDRYKNLSKNSGLDRLSAMAGMQDEEGAKTS